MSLPTNERLSRVLREAATRYRGPALVFDLRVVEKRLVRLAELQEAYGCRFLMAAKAFRAPAVYELAARHLAGFDVSNAAEYAELPASLEGRHVSLTDPAFAGDEVPGLTTKGNSLCVVLDTPGQRERLEAVGTEVAFSIRLASTSFAPPGTRAGPLPDGASRFGIAATQRDALRAMTRCSRHRFAGFHLHHGYGGNVADNYLEMASGCMALVRELGVEISALDLGGGLHRVPEAELPDLLGGLREIVPRSIELFFEPGEVLARGAGFAIARVESVKERTDGYVYTLDLSAPWHLHWSKPVLLQDERDPGEAAREVSAWMFGPTCSEHDFLGEFKVPAPRERGPFAPGDLVTFGSISSYSVSCNRSFNGIPPARLVLLE